MEDKKLKARLGTVRLGVLTISSFVIAVLVTLALGFYQFAVRVINSGIDIEEDRTTFSEYLNLVGPVLGLSIAIIVITALAIYFGYRTYLMRTVAGSGGSSEE